MKHINITLTDIVTGEKVDVIRTTLKSGSLLMRRSESEEDEPRPGR